MSCMKKNPSAVVENVYSKTGRIRTTRYNITCVLCCYVEFRVQACPVVTIPPSGRLMGLAGPGQCQSAAHLIGSYSTGMSNKLCSSSSKICRYVTGLWFPYCVQTIIFPLSIWSIFIHGLFFNPCILFQPWSYGFIVKCFRDVPLYVYHYYYYYYYIIIIILLSLLLLSFLLSLLSLLLLLSLLSLLSLSFSLLLLLSLLLSSCVQNIKRNVLINLIDNSQDFITIFTRLKKKHISWAGMIWIHQTYQPYAGFYRKGKLI